MPALLIGNLPGDVQQEELQYVFATYGEVASVEVFPTSSGGCTAHVTYKDEASGADAIEVLHGQYRIRADAAQAITVTWVDRGTRGSDHPGPPIQQPPVHSDQGHQGVSDRDLPKVFAGGLPEDVTEDELRMVFGTYGEVGKVVITKAGVNGARGALIFYYQRDSGDLAIQMLHGQYRIRDNAASPIQVTWGRDRDSGGGGGGGGYGGFAGGKGDFAPARPQYQDAAGGYKLFVGSLPGDISEDELRQVFATYGTVNQVKVFSPNNKSGMKAAFIIYSEKHSADDAITLLNNQYKIRADAPEPIQVKLAHDQNPKAGGGKGGAYGAPSGYDQGYSGGYGDEWAGHSAYGADPYASYGPAAPAYGGYGACGGGGGGKGHGPASQPPEEPPTGKLYVSNLPEDIPEDDVRYVFGTYGKLNRCHLLRGKSVNGCIAAFIDMDTPDQAITAIEALNRKYEIRPGYGTLTVRHATDKPPNRSRPY
mmetsp:Transcript_45574/g.105713  ORF Transcript_45574/g.105713 Transcript_45574/m.105713 type:complete len:480 (-) Transcript_45574:104-1543(-)